MSLQRHTVQITFRGFLISYSSSTVCYHPDGSNAAEIPCPDPVSLSCCPSEANCLTNGLCWDSRNILFRGSCQDQSWTDPNRPKFCIQCRPPCPNRSTQKLRLTEIFRACQSIHLGAKCSLLATILACSPVITTAPDRPSPSRQGK